MRHIVGCLLFLIAINSYSQQVQQSVKNRFAGQRSQPKMVSLFSKDIVQQTIEQPNRKKLKIDKRVLQKESSSPADLIRISLPLGDTADMEINLVRWNPVASDFRILEQGNGVHEIPWKEINLYQGVIHGKEDSSLVSIVLSKNAVRAIIKVNSKTYELAPTGDSISAETYNLTQVQESMFANLPFCGVEDPKPEALSFPANKIEQLGMVSKCVRTHFEITNGLRHKWGGTSASIEKFMSVFNNVATVYANDGITIKLSFLKIWATKEPYDISDKNKALSTFSFLTKGKLQGDEGHLLTELGDGGVAYIPGQGIPCEGIWAVSGLYDSFADLPVYSWNVMVVAHELGHNLNSPHTQWCGWQGGAIDNCYATEGGCPPGPEPINGGTIMSYCHLSGYGINLMNGFGTQPKARIQACIQNSQCLKSCDDQTTCTDSIARNLSLNYVAESGLMRVSFNVNSSESYKVKWGLMDGTLKDSMVLGFPGNTVDFSPFCNQNNPDHFLSISRQCSSSPAAEMRIVFRPLDFDAKINFADSFICAANSKLLRASPEGTNYIYRWYRDGALIPNQAGDSLRISEAGKYFLTVQDGKQSACLAQSAAQQFVITNQPLPKFSYDFPDVYTVRFLDESLHSTNYRWSFGNGQSVTGSSKPNPVEYSKAGRYPVALTTDGCGGTATFFDTVKIVVDEFDSGAPAIGTYNNVLQGYAENCNQVAVFSKDADRSVTYLVGETMPRKGTMEFQIRLDSGYVGNTVTSENFYILGNVTKNRFPDDLIIELDNANKKLIYYSTNPPPFLQDVYGELPLFADVNFHDWNTIGFSWGDGNTRVFINGRPVGNMLSPFGAYGNTLTKVNDQQIGISLGSCYSNRDTIRRGFYGAIDRFRLSHIENDWKISAAAPVFGQKPILNYSKTVSFCATDSLVLTCSNVPNGSSYSWMKDGKILANANAASVKVFENGWYTCLVTLPNGALCATDSLKVQQLLPTAEIAYTKTAFSTINFNSSTQCASQVLWDFGDGTTSTELNVTKRYEGFGKYKVCFTSYNKAGAKTVCDSVWIWRDWVDNFVDTTIGKSTRINYNQGLCDKAALFQPLSSGSGNSPAFINYNVSDIPREGTIELLVNATGLYNPTVTGTSYAPLFSINGGGVMYNNFFIAYPNGTIECRRYNPATNSNVTVRATNTPFRFNEWHVVSLSFGNLGTQIAVDGVVYATNTAANFPLSGSYFYLGGMNFNTDTWIGLNGMVDRMRSTWVQRSFTLRHTPQTLTITVNASGTNVCKDELLTFTSNSSPSVAGLSTGQTYNWLRNNVSISTNSLLISNAFENGDELKMAYTPANDNCYTASVFTSPPLSISVNPSVAVYSANSGAWSNANTWANGKIPGKCDSVIVLSGHQVMADSTTSVRYVEIAPGNAIILNDPQKTITVGYPNECRGSLVVNGQLSVQAGKLDIFGNLEARVGATLSITGGTIGIAGNRGNPEMSVPDGKHLFYVDPDITSFSFTGGTLQIYDPPLGNNSQAISCPFPFGDGSILKLGGRLPYRVTQNTIGFGGNLLPSQIGKLVLDTKTLTGNRHFINLNPISIKSPLEVISGQLIQNAPLTIRQ